MVAFEMLYLIFVSPVLTTHRDLVLALAAQYNRGIALLVYNNIQQP